MEIENLRLKEFQEFLSKNKVQEDQISKYLSSIRNLQEFLEKENASIPSFPYGLLIKYTEYLVSKNGDSVIDLVRALFNYAPFIGNYDYIEELIDIIESYNAMDNLYSRIAESHGEEIRDEIFKDVTIPPVGVHPEKKPETTKIVMKRLEEKLGEEKTIELLRPCLHGRPQEPILKDKEEFLKLKNIDKFLAKKRQDFIKGAEKNRDEGTVMFAQFVDDEVVDYVKNTPTIGVGIRKGDEIIVTKIPYQIKKFLNAEDERMKRFYICYCPWVRGAIKKGEEQEISSNFCYCSGGFFKMYWDIIFDQPIKVEPLETALWGDLVCKFAVQIPEDIMEVAEK